jgi:hypothetical protein
VIIALVLLTAALYAGVHFGYISLAAPRTDVAVAAVKGQLSIAKLFFAGVPAEHVAYASGALTVLTALTVWVAFIKAAA